MNRVETRVPRSPCLVGLCCNLIVVVVGGVALDLRPSLLPVCDRLPDNARPLDLVEASGSPASV